MTYINLSNPVAQITESKMFLESVMMQDIDLTTKACVYETFSSAPKAQKTVRLESTKPLEDIIVDICCYDDVDISEELITDTSRYINKLNEERIESLNLTNWNSLDESLLDNFSMN